MTLEHFVSTYGYPAVLIGSFFGSDTVLTLAGLAIRLERLDAAPVILLSTLGGMGGYQVYFYLGRHHAYAAIMRFPSWHERLARAQSLFNRYGTPLLLSARYLYGLRAIIPIVVGMGHMTMPRFILLNALGSLLWSVGFVAAGYLLGSAIETFMGDVKKYEIRALLLLVLIGGVLFLLFRFHRRRKRRME